MDRSTTEATLETLLGHGFSATSADLKRVRGNLAAVIPTLLATFTDLQSGLANQSEELSRMRTALRGTDSESGLLGEIRTTLEALVAKMLGVGERTSELLDRFEALGREVEAIVSRVDGLRRLTHRTKFVALNARLEAQRTGEWGRTFRVVADEVKVLAEDCAGHNHDVREVIERVSAVLSESLQLVGLLAAKGFDHVLDEHSTVLKAMVELDATNQRATAGAGRAQEDAANAVRALQFDDILSQLLVSICERVSCLEGLWASWVLARKDGTQEAWEALQKALEGADGALTHAQHVQQTSMGAGTIELF